MSENKSKLYIAYGSNLNVGQMRHRCPTAAVVGKSVLKNYRMVFRGDPHFSYATVEPDENSSVPVLLWNISEGDEQALDRFESCPSYYRKETVSVDLDGKATEGMIYVMNGGHPLGSPSDAYFAILHQGYREAGFDTKILTRFAYGDVETAGGLITPRLKEQILAIRDSGETNMFDVNAVQYLANQRSFHELVCFVEDHRKEYVTFILFGDILAGEES